MKPMIRKLRKTVRRMLILVLMTFSPYFDAKWYRAHVKEDIPRGHAARHYLDGGWKTCDPSPIFSNKRYLEANPDVAGADYAPLEHYLLHGIRENRPVSTNNHDVVASSGVYHAHRLRRTVSRWIGRMLHAGQIRRNNGARILVCVQLFYPKSWGEVEQYLLNLAPYHCDMVFTYESEKLWKKILPRIRARWPQARFCLTPNKGFDIGPFHTSLQGVDLDQYDVVIKVHTKGTTRKELTMYGQYFRRRDWLLYLFEGILGARTVHETIDQLLHVPDCAMVAAENLLVEDPRHKVNMLKRTVRELNLPVTVPEHYRYVAGTCFACRPDVMKEFQQTSLDFEPSRRGFFSLAHCVERSMCFPAQRDGNSMYGNSVCRLRRWVRSIQGRSKQYPARERLLNDPSFDLNDEFVYRSIETRKILDYELVTMRLGDIKRRWFDGVCYALKDCAPYRYLMGDDEAYEEYSRFHKIHNLPPMTRERFNALIESMDKNGYDKRQVLVVNQDNIIMDGQHRACVLLKKFGEDYQVTVLRIYLG